MRPYLLWQAQLSTANVLPVGAGGEAHGLFVFQQLSEPFQKGQSLLLGQADHPHIRSESVVVGQPIVLVPELTTQHSLKKNKI